MEQVVKRVFYPVTDREVKEMAKEGYYVKQISGASTNDYVWILFEKINNSTL